jgi:hypothetical protein
VASRTHVTAPGQTLLASASGLSQPRPPITWHPCAPPAPQADNSPKVGHGDQEGATPSPAARSTAATDSPAAREGDTRYSLANFLPWSVRPKAATPPAKAPSAGSIPSSPAAGGSAGKLTASPKRAAKPVRPMY